MVAGKKRIGKKFVVSELLLTFAVLNEKNVNNNSNYLNKMTKKTMVALLLALLSAVGMNAAQPEMPWQNGKLTVKGRYLAHENGTPFFWQGETGWLLPELHHERTKGNLCPDTGRQNMRPE